MRYIYRYRHGKTGIYDNRKKLYKSLYLYVYRYGGYKVEMFSPVLCLVKWNSSISFYCWIVGCGVGLPIVLHVFMILSLKCIRS